MCFLHAFRGIKCVCFYKCILKTKLWNFLMYITCKVTLFTRSSIFFCYSCASKACDVVSIALTSLSYPMVNHFTWLYARSCWCRTNCLAFGRLYLRTRHFPFSFFFLIYFFTPRSLKRMTCGFSQNLVGKASELLKVQLATTHACANQPLTFVGY